jgi:large subunit ribosomal protein L11
MQFVQAYNEATRTQTGTIIPVELTIYDDRSFTFVTKTPPASELIKKAIGAPKGSGANRREKAGKLTEAQLRDIAQMKMQDLNANDIEGAMKIIAGTARSMGIEVG